MRIFEKHFSQKKKKTFLKAILRAISTNIDSFVHDLSKSSLNTFFHITTFNYDVPISNYH